MSSNHRPKIVFQDKIVHIFLGINVTSYLGKGADTFKAHTVPDHNKDLPLHDGTNKMGAIHFVVFSPRIQPIIFFHWLHGIHCLRSTFSISFYSPILMSPAPHHSLLPVDPSNHHLCSLTIQVFWKKFLWKSKILVLINCVGKAL